jgi:hypothetical protein
MTSLEPTEINPRLANLLGAEHGQDHISRELRYLVQDERPAVVGAHLVTCSDELEHACSHVFRRWFALGLIPDRGHDQSGPFRTANLAGRYEWGGAQIAADHFTATAAEGDTRALLVKINAHVGVSESSEGRVYGPVRRYDDSDSHACGALYALLANQDLPSIHALRDDFASEGVDRVALLADPEQVEPRYRMLFAAIAHARLQARRAIIDIQDHAWHTPIIFWVVASVSLNRESRSHEIVCGLYRADYRGPQPTEQYCGLGDNPANYEVAKTARGIAVSETEPFALRDARDHRELVLDEWRGQVSGDQAAPHELREALVKARDGITQSLPYGRVALKALLPLLISVAPVPAAMAFFGAGALGIHHLYRMRRLARSVDSDEEARQVLGSLEAAVDDLPPERAKAVIELLAAHYR